MGLADLFSIKELQETNDNPVWVASDRVKKSTHEYKIIASPSPLKETQARHSK